MDEGYPDIYDSLSSKIIDYYLDNAYYSYYSCYY